MMLKVNKDKIYKNKFGLKVIEGIDKAVEFYTHIPTKDIYEISFTDGWLELDMNNEIVYLHFDNSCYFEDMEFLELIDKLIDADIIKKV